MGRQPGWVQGADACAPASRWDLVRSAASIWGAADRLAGWASVFDSRGMCRHQLPRGRPCAQPYWTPHAYAHRWSRTQGRPEHALWMVRAESWLTAKVQVPCTPTLEGRRSPGCSRHFLPRDITGSGRSLWSSRRTASRPVPEQKRAPQRGAVGMRQASRESPEPGSCGCGPCWYVCTQWRWRVGN